MKLGVAYNVFDGYELLEHSIKSIRDHVDFICIVFQCNSNYGNKLKGDYCAVLDYLHQSDLVDQIYFYSPDFNQDASHNEVIKRNLGKRLCMDYGCTHFMTMDADELYNPNEFKEAKEVAELFDSTACKMLTYYKTPGYVLDPPEEYYVPFIYKLDDRKFGNVSWPVDADPTRKLKPNNIYFFYRKDLQMHHFSYVREDIRQKLENSSAKVNWPHRINKIVDYFEKWDPSKPALIAGSQDRFYKTRQVKTLITLKPYVQQID